MVKVLANIKQEPFGSMVITGIELLARMRRGNSNGPEWVRRDGLGLCVRPAEFSRQMFFHSKCTGIQPVMSSIKTSWGRLGGTSRHGENVVASAVLDLEGRGDEPRFLARFQLVREFRTPINRTTIFACHEFETFVPGDFSLKNIFLKINKIPLKFFLWPL